MVKNAGTASIKRETVNPRTVNTHESMLRCRITNPENSQLPNLIKLLKEKIMKEKD
jgi:hypothetical protein